MRKKSVRKAVETFLTGVDAIEQFAGEPNIGGLSDAHQTWCYDFAIIRLYREFESFMLECLVASINNDTAQLSKTTGISFPKHLTDEVCEYIIVREGYFDFRGRDGLIHTLKRFVPGDHYLVTAVKDAKFRHVLEQLSALRNFAAHESGPSKQRALDAVGYERMSAAGAWLKKQNRFGAMTKELKALAAQIRQHAPH